ncbi:MAG: heavy metal sensor histidine kinase [Stagnimonas sp.]|nr:heavy metal sensor histidine kinase [Stagnimonas sp.]
MRRGSLKLRLALLVGVLGLAQAAAVLFFSYLTFERELDAQRRAVLVDKARQARQLIDEMRDGAMVKASAFKLVDLVTGRAELHMAVAGPAGGETYVAFSPEAAESLERLRNDVWQTNGLLNWRTREGRRALLSLATAGKTANGQPYEVVLSIDRSEDMRLLRQLLLTAGTAAPFALAIVFFSALVIVAIGLKPLEGFRSTVEGVTAHSLARRIHTQTLPDELRRLGEAFNLMLDRLDDGVTRLSQFSADLAHEMRTPLSTLLGRTQVALSQTRTQEQLIDVMERNIDELQRLSRLVGDMLFLAQADHAKQALDLQWLDLAGEARNVAEFLDLDAQERGMNIMVEGQARIMADRSLVQRAVINLATNAIRHGSAGSEVRIAISSRGEQVVLEVVNQGTPIDTAHLARLFDRFYRIDSSRGREHGGTGLGLAIVKAIMKLHSGTAEAANEPGGKVRFWLSFPASHPV